MWNISNALPDFSPCRQRTDKTLSEGVHDIAIVFFDIGAEMIFVGHRLTSGTNKRLTVGILLPKSSNC